MRTLLLLLCPVLFVFGQHAGAQTVPTFYKAFRLSNSQYERAKAVLPFRDGRIIVAGETISCTGSSCFNASSLTCFDAAGNLRWQKKIGDMQDNMSATQLVQASPSSFVAVGYSVGNLFAYKLDTAGTILWERRLVMPRYSTTGSVTKIDSLYYVIGGDGSSTTFLICLNESGAVKWCRNFGGPGSAEVPIAAITSSANGRLMLICKSETGTTEAAVALKLDRNGAVLDSKVLNPSFLGYMNSSAFSICRIRDNNFILSWADNSGRHLTKMDSSLNLLWSRRLTTAPAFNGGFPDHLIPDSSGGCWYVSYFYQGIGTVHFDATGAVTGSNQYRFAGDVGLMNGAVTSGCNLIVCGYMQIGNQYHQLLAKLDPAGKISCFDTVFTATTTVENITATPYALTTTLSPLTATPVQFFSQAGTYAETIFCTGSSTSCIVAPPPGPNGFSAVPAENRPVLYPNPARDAVTIDCGGTGKPLSIRLTDLQGRTLRRLPAVVKQSYPLGDLPAGLYLLHVTTADGVFTMRVVRE